MKQSSLSGIVQWLPLIFFALLIVVFGIVSPQFLSVHNVAAILSQSSWLVVIALGMNVVLLTAGVDLSVGAAMYLAAVVVGLSLTSSSVWICLLTAVIVGALFGALNGLIVVVLRIPAFVVTLAMLFVGRGLGLYLSGTKIVFASSVVAEFGRSRVWGITIPVLIAIAAILASVTLMHTMALGTYIRALGADREGARRAGVPVQTVTWRVYAICGAFAGLGGFVSLSQTSAASGAFGQHAEFLAIAAAVLGGTSLFGGRGSYWAAPSGAVLIMTVQNGLVMINANPYAYPIITGAVVLFAALIDGFRSKGPVGFRGRPRAAASP